jgi:hypothetical protein
MSRWTGTRWPAWNCGPFRVFPPRGRRNWSWRFGMRGVGANSVYEAGRVTLFFSGRWTILRCCNADCGELNLSPGVVIAAYVDLAPEERLEVPLRFTVPAGAYRFVAGYGGGVYRTRTVDSNSVDFQVDGTGKASLWGGSRALNRVRKTAALREVCGRVSLEDGSAAGYVIADPDGGFRMEGIVEGVIYCRPLRCSRPGCTRGRSAGSGAPTRRRWWFPRIRRGVPSCFQCGGKKCLPFVGRRLEAPGTARRG